MSQSEFAGVYQLDNGYWGYRYAIVIGGKRKESKKVRNDVGLPFKTAKQAARARERAIIQEQDKKELVLQRKQNQIFIQDLNGEQLSSVELVNALPNGKIQTVNSMKYHSRTLQGKYGILFKYHYLRHTYGTNLAALNTPEYLLCNQMWHSNSQVTHKYYVAIS